MLAKIAQTKRQRAIAAAIELIRTAARQERRDLTTEEREQIDELTLAWPPGHESLLRWREVSRRVGLSRSQIWKRVRRKEFPEPIALSDNRHAVGWVASEVEAWVQARVRQRDQQQQRRVPKSPGRPSRKASAQIHRKAQC